MNSDFPPLQLPPPRFHTRRPERPRRPPLPPELLARRAEIARVLGVQVDALSEALKSMPDDERRAMFYKLEHDQPIDLTGTGLKPIIQPGKYVTLAVPREDNLAKFKTKIDEFGTKPESKGHVPHEDYAHITSISPGEPKDRLSDELASQYDELCREEFVICEIEIISLQRGPNQQRAEIRSILDDLQQAFANGVHGTLFEHEEIRGTCRAVIRVTGKMFKTLVEERVWQRKISWFEPKPKFQTFQSIWREFDVAQLGEFEPPANDAPVVCIIDTGITPGNPFLQPVTREELLFSFLNKDPENPYDEYGHGSGVASLAAYYALNIEKGASNKANVWVAGARVLDESNQLEPERLFSKVIGEVVKTFIQHDVRIFVLAIGDLAKTWNADTKRTVPRRSWVARTLDRLARDHDVIFVTCTGNIDLPTIRHFLEMDQQYPKYLVREDTRILDPGQASLALTIGSIAPTTLVTSSSSTAIASKDEPSPFTRSGPGIRDDVKPELVDYGGNLVLDSSGQWVRDNPGTNVVMASHQLSPALALDQGTSYAAPRAAYKLALVLKDLEDFGVAPVSASLLKAFLVNSATYRGAENLGHVQAELEGKQWLNVLGYGFPSHGIATYCDDYTTILYYQGEITPNEVAFFDVPIPESLRDSKGTKRITTTVVHSPEVQRWGLERYHGTDLKWRMFRGNVSQEEVIAAMSAVEDADLEGGEQPELPNELQFEHKLNRRSRGTIQHDFHEWTQHREGYSDNHYTLAVAAYERWNRTNPAQLPFAIVVRLDEVDKSVKVYGDIAAILTELEVRARAQA